MNGVFLRGRRDAPILTTSGKNRDGTYIAEFRTAAGEALAISILRTEAAVIRHFREGMPVCRTGREEPLARLMVAQAALI